MFFMRLILIVLFARVSLIAQPLPGTLPLTLDGDLAARMLEGMDRFLSLELAASASRRDSRWARDFSSAEAYEKSIAPNRERFRRIIGVVDRRVGFEGPRLEAGMSRPDGLVATGAGYRVFAVRWPVLEGIEGEGLLLEPTAQPLARIVALPDADWPPEALAGLAPGVPAAAQFARRLAESGCQVLVPVLLSRRPTGIINPAVPRPTNQTHREFVYRMAFEVGRHVIGYEVQKVLAAVDWFSRLQPARPVGTIGYGEGGLLALHSAAAAPQIAATVVSGYFRSREGLWREPVYRNVWGLLAEFGDAELAGLVAPRTLIIEASRGPESLGSPPANLENGTGAAP